MRSSGDFPMDSFIRILRVFVVVGGVTLICGTALLIWMLANRSSSGSGGASPGQVSMIPETIILPEGSRIDQIAVDGSNLYILLTLGEGARAIALVDVNEASGIRVIPVVRGEH
ncbi:MAG: DUF6476 family protein [Pseudomonadota bacterium]